MDLLHFVRQLGMRTFLWTGYAASPGVGMMNWTPGQERKVFKMTQRRKRYDRQFKVSAAKVVLSGEMTVKDLSEELGIKDSTLRRWAREYEEMGDDAFPGNGSPKINKDYEIVKLRKRVEEPGRENGILKNLRAFLSQDHARGAGSSKSIGARSAPSRRHAG